MQGAYNTIIKKLSNNFQLCSFVYFLIYKIHLRNLKRMDNFPLKLSEKILFDLLPYFNIHLPYTAHKTWLCIKEGIKALNFELDVH